MSPWLFKILDIIVKEVKASVREQGASTMDGGERKWEVSQLWFGDDTALAQ